MRIGLIIYGGLDTETGGYLYDRMVTRRLRQRGHAVEVIGLPGGTYLAQIGQGLSAGLCHRLLAGGFDVLVQDELCHPALFVVNQRLRRQGGPMLVALVHHVRCREPRRYWQNAMLAAIERRYLASVDGFIHNSETTRRTVANLVGNGRPQIVAYPAGNRLGPPLDTASIASRALRPGPLQLLYVGMVIPRKGLPALLKALAAVDRRCWRLAVVGRLDVDPAHASDVRRLARRLGLSDAVHFHGFLPDRELIAVMRTSHLFCMPFAYEGFGIALLEAMAFGLPAVGSRQGAAGETIRHGTNGFLIDPEDVTGLAPILATLQRDREKLRRMSLAARQTYAARPTWRDSVDRIERFLDKMARMPPRRAAAI
jgi:glycosyltransferase involved in cell wall biosynthesis